jgi:threonine/homoserine/homoserine lactone efflux protein
VLISTLLAFVLVAGLVIVTPGPDMALVTRNVLVHGRQAALLTALGIEAGLLVWTGASLLGIAALLAASALAFTVVKLAGAAYLVFLGLRTLLSLRGPGSAGHPTGLIPNIRSNLPRRLAFQQGLLSNLLNPKIAVFFTSLIPQFVTPGPAATLRSVVLAGIFMAMGLIWLTTYAVFADTVRSTLQRRPVKRLLDAVSGLVLVGLGVRLAVESR